MTKKTLNRDEIMELLPHRDPFLHIDRIVDYDLGASIIAEKDINLTQDFRWTSVSRRKSAHLHRS